MLRFTIGIPVRNGERYLGKAIESAVRQSRPADEILVIDDASTDGTAPIATASRWAGRVRYVLNDRPTGFADAFNRIARLAEGSHVVVLCADDLLDEECLASLERGLLAHPSAGLCYTGFQYIDAEGRPTGMSPGPHSHDAVFYSGMTYSQRYLAGVQSGQHIHRCVGFAVEQELMRTRCPFRREAGLIADDDFFVRIGAITDVVGVSKPLASVRHHSGAMSFNLDSLSLRLATDYMFQVRGLAETSLHPMAQHRAIYHELALRFVDQLFWEGLQRARGDLLSAAIQLQREFEELVPDHGSIRAQGWRQTVRHFAAHHPRSTRLFERLVSSAGNTLRAVSRRGQRE